MGYLEAIKTVRRGRSEELFDVVFTATRGDDQSIKDFFKKS